MKFLTRFFEDRSGATAVEYGLICALIAIAAIGGLTAVSDKIGVVFAAVGNATPVP